jgi:hypothetical protein
LFCVILRVLRFKKIATKELLCAFLWPFPFPQRSRIGFIVLHRWAPETKGNFKEIERERVD